MGDTVHWYLQHSGVSKRLSLKQEGQVFHYLGQLVIDSQGVLVGSPSGIAPLLSGKDPTL